MYTYIYIYIYIYTYICIHIYNYIYTYERLAKLSKTANMMKWTFRLCCRTLCCESHGTIGGSSKTIPPG